MFVNDCICRHIFFKLKIHLRGKSMSLFVCVCVSDQYIATSLTFGHNLWLNKPRGSLKCGQVFFCQIPRFNSSPTMIFLCGLHRFSAYFICDMSNCSLHILCLLLIVLSMNVSENNTVCYIFPEHKVMPF